MLQNDSKGLVDVLFHIKQRLGDEGERSEGAKEIIDKFIAEENEYRSTILRN